MEEVPEADRLDQEAPAGGTTAADAVNRGRTKRAVPPGPGEEKPEADTMEQGPRHRRTGREGTEKTRHD